MNKTELISALSKQAELSAADAKRTVETLVDIITAQLGKHEEVRIPGFGTFGTRQRAARTGINPKTGESIQIAARTTPFFSAGSRLKAAANGE